MPVSNILEIPVLTETMAQKTIAVNMAIQAMEGAIAGKLAIATTDAVSSGFDIVIPFNDINDLSSRLALRAIFYDLLAGATQNFDVIHPDNAHLFIVRNSTTRAATFKTETGGTTVVLPSLATFLIYCDGLNMVKMDFTVTDLVQANDFNFGFYGQPEASQIMGRVMIGREVVFPGNLDGIRGRVDVNPLVSHTLELWDDGTQIATITISTGGIFSATTTGGGAAKTVGAGSRLELRNSGVKDTLLDVVELVIPATVTVAQPYP